MLLRVALALAWLLAVPAAAIAATGAVARLTDHVRAWGVSWGLVMPEDTYDAEG